MLKITMADGVVEQQLIDDLKTRSRETAPEIMEIVNEILKEVKELSLIHI